jgi:acyl-CoA reductase-like NAD-dependent aldehyde dehydrogenase
MHQITLTVHPSAYAASVDELDAAIADASKDYLERVLPAHRAALAEAAAEKARQQREAELIDGTLRRRFPGMRAPGQASP